DAGVQIVGNASGTLTVAAGATLGLGTGGATSEGFPTLFTSISLDSLSTVHYNTASAGAQTISAAPSSYGNLTLSASSTKTAAGALTVKNNLTINAGTFADGGFTITVKGGVASNSTHSGAGKILLTGGSASHTLTGTATYGKLELDDLNGANYSSSGATTVSQTLTVTNGTLTLGA